MKGEKIMRNLQNTLNKIGSIIPKIAISIGLSTSDQACIWWFHQPKVPVALERKNR